MFLYGAYGRLESNVGATDGDELNRFYYVKAGLRERWTPLGHTVLYGEYKDSENNATLFGIQAFQDEGYQRDLLFMMFFSSIAISNRLMVSIDDAVATRCEEIGRNAIPGGGMTFARQACAYIASGPYRPLFDPAGSHPAGYSFSLKTCRDTGGAINDDAPKDMVHFNNAPARESRDADDPHPVVCFQILLDDLLILSHLTSFLPRKA